jgi:PAS domain S-box-containing protein
MAPEVFTGAAYESALRAFAVEPFELRLGRWLDAVRSLCGAEGAALVEVDVRDGRLGQRVRIASGLAAEGLTIAAETFARWLADADAAHDFGALGGDFVGRAGRVIALAVSPRWAQGIDAALCLTSTATPPAELVAGLAAALSDDREERTTRLLGVALQQSADTVELTDADVRVVHVNRAFERLFGYARDELVGGDLRRLRDDDAPRHDPQFYLYAEESVAHHGAWRSTIGSRSRHGRSVTAEISVNSIDAPALRFRGNLGIRRELQHRAARETALAIAHLEIRAVLGRLPDAIVVARDGEVYFGNAPFFKILGRAADEVLSAPLARFVHPEDLARLDAALGQGVSGLRMLRADGSVRIVDVRSAGEISFEGRASGIALVEDTTERRLRQVRDEHANRLSALGGLAASVAHEINNPLAALTANLEWLGEIAAGDEQRAVLRESLAGARRIRQIIADLKSFSRDGAAAAGDDAVEVRRALQTALNLTANELRHFAEVDASVAPGLAARCKEGPLVQVLVNLIQNASQAMRTVPDRRHRLRVAVEDHGDTVELAVIDTGPGIAPSILPHLFAPFVSSRTDAGGTGLGLWISRRIVEGFGGTLQVESAAGEGSIFRVTLPSARPRETSPPSSPPTARGRAGARVVVIDDEAPVARALARLLAGHHVECFDDSRAALRRVTAGELPDAVFCDLMMPGLNGDALFEQACALRPALRGRFVFVTGGSFSDDTSAFLAQGPAPVLFKPFNAAEIRDALDARLAAARAD